MLRRNLTLGTMALVLAAGTAGQAQSITTGGISGVIRDAQGKSIAGANIQITSAQTTRTAVSAADGSYRFALLNPGSWQIRVTREGFQTVTTSLMVQANKDDQFHIRMASSASAIVEVTAAATQVDLTTTQTGLVVSSETFSAIPKGRDMSSLTFLSPGVTAGGFGGSDPSIGGGSAAENAYIVDGLTTTNFSRGFQGATLVTDFIDQVEVQTGGFKPEFSALGGVVNAITKSGTNEFQGGAWVNFDARSLQAKPKRDAFTRQADPADRYDVGFSAGGAFIKERLFYFFGVNNTRTINVAGDSARNETGQVASDSKNNALQLLAKVNWYASENHQLTLSNTLVDTRNTQDRAYSTYGDSNQGGETKSKQTNISLNWDWTISPTLFLSTKFGVADSTFSFLPVDMANAQVVDNYWYVGGPGRIGGPAPRPASVDAILAKTGTAPAYVRGGSGAITWADDNRTQQGKLDLNWFLGNHTLRFGISQLDTRYTSHTGASGASVANPFGGAGASTFNGVFQTIRSNGSLQELFQGRNATVNATFRAIYAQDSWEITPGLRAFYGFRFESQEQKDLNGRTFLKFDDLKEQLQPRIGFTWDLENNGRKKVSGSYARYFEAIPQRMAIRVFANEYFSRFRYSTANTQYDINTGNFGLPAGVRFNSYTSFIDFATPFNNDPIAENIKLPHRDEFTLGYDESFGNGWTAGIHGKYRKFKDPIEDMVFTDDHGNPYDEGVDIGAGFGVGAAVLGNPGPFIQWRPNPNSLTVQLYNAGATHNNYGIRILDYYNPATGLITVPNTRYEEAGNTYVSVDFTLERKTARSYVNFSYTWSRLEGNYQGVVSSTNGQADGNITASFDYYPYVGYGLLPLDRTHVAKLFGSRRIDLGNLQMNLGFNWTYLSGTPISRFDNTNDLGGYGNATPVDGQLGQFGRNPANHNVDMRLDTTIAFAGGKVKMTPSVDVFNLFNTRIATGSVEQLTDGNGDPNEFFGSPTGWQVGRRYRFGLKFQF